MKMNNARKMRSFKRSYLAWPLAAFLWAPGALSSATAAEASGTPAGKPATMGQTTAQCPMDAQCKAMMGLQTELKNSDAQLDKLLAAMNQARGRRRIKAIEAVVNNLAAQREEVNQQILAMETDMTQATTAAKPRRTASSAACPMMKSINGMMSGGMMNGGKL